jgi:peptide/nickel transport system substrate-binding protein
MEGSGDKPLPEERTAKGGNNKKIAVIAVVVILIIAVLAAALVLNGGNANYVEPTATFTAPSQVNLGNVVEFNASASDGKILNYTWELGDGNSRYTTTPFLNYTYSNAGKMLVTLIVTDAKKSVTSAPVNITVNAITGPLNVTTLEAYISSTADPQNNEITAGTIVAFDGSLSTGYSWNGTARNESATAISNYTWKLNGAVVSYNMSYANNFTVNGQYVISLTVSNATLGKSNTYLVTVFVYTVSLASGKTFVNVTIGSPQTLDPAVDYETSGGEILQNVYETLVWYNGSSASNLTGMLATVVPSVANGGISPDGLNYTFHLRQGVYFHDGNLMTSADVKYSIQRLLEINDPSGPAWILGQVLIPNYGHEAYANQSQINAAITTPDNYTVVFHLISPYPAFLYCMAFTEASVVSMKYVEAHGGIVPGQDNAWMEDHECGTGPYELVTWASNQYILLERNNNYWRSPAAIQYVIIKDVANVGTREMLLENGDADTAYIPIQNEADVSNISTLRIVQGMATFNIDFLGLNEKINTTGSLPIGVPSTFFADKNIRLAFANAFNYSNYLSVALLGSAVEPNGPIPAGMLDYNASIPKFNYDLVAAADYLKNATNPNGGGSYADTGFSVDLYYNSGNTARQYACDLLATGLQALKTNGLINGTITVTVTALDWPTFLGAEQTGQLPAYYLGWAPDYADPADYVGPFIESSGTFGSIVGLNDTNLTTLAMNAATELNSTLRAEMYSNISMQVYHNCYYIWTDQQTVFHVERTWVTGYEFNPMYSGLYYYDLNKTG